LRKLDMVHSMQHDVNEGALQVLVENHRRFLAFLLPRVRQPEDAEEIRQSAFVRASEKEATIRTDESAVAWFYRLLRNALIDYYRRLDIEQRALDFMTVETQSATDSLDDELKGTVCACLYDLLPTLKPEYAELLRQVDLNGVAVPVMAETLGITANNAGVRLHRARQALKERLVESCGTCTIHGCLDCTCKSC